jgi:hypothetical protein
MKFRWVLISRPSLTSEARAQGMSAPDTAAITIEAATRRKFRMHFRKEIILELIVRVLAKLEKL